MSYAWRFSATPGFAWTQTAGIKSGGALEWPGGYPELMQLNREEYCGYENRPHDAYYNGEVYCPAANSEPIKKKWAEKRWWNIPVTKTTGVSHIYILGFISGIRLYIPARSWNLIGHKKLPV